MPLADLQRALAASLTAAGAPCGGLCATELARARDALAAKRCRALAHLLPRTAAALGAGGYACFRRHCARYTPSAILYHVDDAWELAAQLAGDAGAGLAVEGGSLPSGAAAPAASAAVRAAARQDLRALRQRYQRRRRRGSLAIRERRRPPLCPQALWNGFWRTLLASLAAPIEAFSAPRRRPRR